MIHHDEIFPAVYDVIEEGTSKASDLAFSTDGASLLAPSLILRVMPITGDAWRGDFFGGRETAYGISQVVNSPATDRLLVVAGGIGYVVPSADPTTFWVLPLRPIVAVLAMPAAGVVVCVGLTKLVALGSDESVQWSSPRLVADGFSDVKAVSDSVLVACGWDAETGRPVEVSLDVASGAVLSRQLGNASPE